MSVEVACGNCQGRLLADSPGTVVICPHCGSQLTIPWVFTDSDESEAGPSGDAAFPDVNPEPAPTPPAAEAEQPIAAAEPRDLNPEPGPIILRTEPLDAENKPAPSEAEPLRTESEPEPANLEAEPLDAENEPAPPAVEPFRTESEPAPADAESVRFDSEPIHSGTEQSTAEEGAEPQGAGVPDFMMNSVDAGTSSDQVPSIGSEADREGGIVGWFPIDDRLPDEPPPASFSSDFVPAADAAASGNPFIATETDDSPEPQAESQPFVPAMGREPNGNPGRASKAAAAAQTAPSPPDAAGISRTTFLILVSYASAITVAFIILLIRSLNPDPHHLESLPDLVPKIRNQKVAYELVPEEASMARGHVLRLGEEQRFGSLKVTPLRVTRGPLEFVHFTGDDAQSRPPEGPVLKLWLRIENVSEDQVFAPLDRKLLLTRVPGNEQRSLWRSNNFVCRVAEKSERNQKVLVYDLPPTSSWEWKGHDDERELAPGEVYETYIPTTQEGVDQLSGDLVWRVHFRKGYNPESFRGVTTLIEVRFRSDQIDAEPGFANS